MQMCALHKTGMCLLTNYYFPTTTLWYITPKGDWKLLWNMVWEKVFIKIIKFIHSM